MLEEALIVKYKEENPNMGCAYCGCVRHDHKILRGKKIDEAFGKCLVVKKIPTKQLQRNYARYVPWRRPYSWTKQKLFNLINSLSSLFYYKLQACWCDGYAPALPMAVQVKEKYGTLRFYMNHSSKEMEDLISEAEALTAKTCETCGLAGVLRGPGWYFTACNTHAINRSGEYIEPVGKEEE